jgi:hypothetical protein
VLAGIARARWPGRRAIAEWPLPFAIALVFALVKVALFWHPFVNVGDALFQVHRAQLVHAGEWFFTSVTPRPFFEFPYAIALFVAAQPFWSWFPTELDLARLLRAIAIGADALVGCALYVAARRSGWPRPVAIAGAALWPIARAPLEALTNANLTNLFGQGVFGAGLAGTAALAAAPPARWFGWIAAGALVTIGFLSHFGTLTVGLVMLAAVAAVLSVFGRGWARWTSGAIAGVTLAAALISWVAYYSHPRFVAVYSQTYASVRAGDRDDSSKLVASPAVKLQRWWSGQGDDYGRPGIGVLVAAAIGVWFAFRRRPRDGATLAFAGWLGAWLALSALGILTPITLRANLAAAPAFVYFAALGVGTLAGAGRAGQLAAAALAAAAVWDGWAIVLRA